MSLEFPPFIKSGVFCFFLWLSDGLNTSFFTALHPDSKVGNSQLQGTRFYYLSFYGHAG